MSTDTDIMVLNRKKGSIKGQLTKLHTFISQKENKSETVITTHLEILSRTSTKFEKLRNEFYRTVPDDDFEEVESSLSEIEDDIFQIEVSLKSLLHELRLNTSDSNSSDAKSIDKTVSIKLPEIPLPVFNGKIEEWNSFKQQFLNLINDNPNLTENQKCYYLRSCLRKEAKSIETSEDNYQSLLKALEERFENKRIIVDTHIKNIINHEKIVHESAKDLRKLLDNIHKNLRALKVLKYDRNDLSNVLLINIILQKLDRETRKQFELSLVDNEVPDFNEFLEFLERRYQILNAIGRNVPFKSKHSDAHEQMNKTKSLFVKSSNFTKSCILCKDDSHSLHKCDQFFHFSPQKRYETVRENHLCLNCLGFHKVTQCRSKHSCFHCKARHHSLLHRPQLHIVNDDSSPSLNASSTPADATPDTSSLSNVSPLTSCFVTQKKRVILATSVVYVLDNSGSIRKGRALLDSGSMCNLMSSDFAQTLGLKKEKINIPVSGISDTAFNAKRKSTGTILNSDGSFSATLDFLVIPKITDLMPSTSIDLEEIKIPSYVKLADPNFFSPAKVDLLIGAELFFSILKENRLCINNSLILQETVFGHVLSGTVEGKQEIQHCGLISQVENLDNLVKKFWEVENITDMPTSKNKEELECENHFMQTYRRDKDGKYIVSLPLKENMQLGNSIQIAKQRLDSLWKRLNNDSSMANLYCNFMKEYEELGHMQKIDNSDNLKYVMPHHGVYRADSSTTKLRVVFDASAASTSGVSLNNCLLKGGVVQDDLFSILLRFRKHQVAFTADVKKMYRQIWVNLDQCNFQCILWKNRSCEEPSLYKLLTVTYGTKSAPYLATRVLNQLATDERKEFPLASAVALKDFYVDDVLSGADNVSSALKLQQELISLLKAGGMELHKWCANNEMLLENVPTKDQGYQFGDSDKDTVKTLGLRWNPKEDCFNFTITPSASVPTKRTVLADIAKLFDPLGFLGPVIVKAKIFLQKLWLQKFEWDQELPHQEKVKWETLRDCLNDLTNVRIQRYILTDSIKLLELHGLSDASKDAFGAVVYLRCVTILNHVKVSLLCSKSKVAPLKSVTIPRLELCAAELLSKLISKAVISRIHELTKDFSWHHVKTSENPDDIISRGMTPQQLMDNSLWWNGPQFLQQVTVELSDKNDIPTDDDYLHELKRESDKTLALTLDSTFLDALLSISNNYSKLIRVVSFLFRFVNNSRNPKSKLDGPLTTMELQRAKLFLIKSVQKIAFQDNVKLLLQGKQPSGKIKNLNPFLDDNGILRVGGRIQNSSVNFDQKHPIILPDKNNFTKIVIQYFHLKNMHLGQQNLLYCVRREFWPLNGRSICRKIVHSCITCFKAKPLTNDQIMGSLPKERVNVNSPFNCTGIDFCGPFFIKYKGQRKGIYHKIYVCIFVCMVTKALQQRNKWMIKKQNLKVGDMALIKEENLPCCKWILGRIVDVFYGKDNVVRVVNVKTHSGIYKRSISKIAPLPLEN
ncbi:hypothetical protein AVEN_39181-1 [Araneus ventricosus]|uniref:Peptidase aspartic putative domain-containing protein n=1 Tax=Araneus ventricosus TaxID=182803 RepID=A0A4Y2HKU0_ARAVE|nr:hypothetical protein AVEN_39181-1 [Araneus ventricosus]